MTTSLSKLTPVARACRTGRDAIPDALRDVANWPSVDEERLAKVSKLKAKRYKQLRSAIELYLSYGALGDCLKLANIKKSGFYRALGRCLAIHPEDGRIYGFRALIKDARVKKPQRKKEFIPQDKPTSGYAHLFSGFMRDHPEIRAEVVAYLRGVGAAVVRMNEVQGRQAHRAFVKACRNEEYGIGEDEYPLRTKEQGKRAFRKWIDTDFLPLYGRDWVAREYGPSAETAFGYQDGDGQASLPILPGEAWQIDEYKIDEEAGYEYPNAFGDYEVYDLPWTIAIRAIDVGSGARFATRLVLATQASAEDLSRLLWDAVNGIPELTEVLPGLKPKHGAGYIANQILALRFSVPRIVYLDNALSHLADHIRHIIQHVWGGELRLGKPATPQERGAVEASFAKMAKGLIRHMPFAVGSGPQDPLRKAAAAAGHKRLASDALEHSIHVYSMNENVLPAAASMNISPIERLNRQLATKALIPTYVPADKRHAHFFCKSKPVPVKADLKGKNPRRPYVNYMYTRYSSPLLMRSITLIGKKLFARPDLDNLQTIWLFNEDGSEFGPVNVQGKWGGFPHDIRIRKMFGKLKAEGALGEHAEDDPLDAIFKALRPKAATNRHAAQKLAYLFTYLQRHGFPVSAVIVNEILHWQATVLAAEGISLIPVVNAQQEVPAPAVDDPNVIDMEPVGAAPSEGASADSAPPALPAPQPLRVPAPAIVAIVNRAAAAAAEAAAAAPAPHVPQTSHLNLPRRVAR